MSIDIIAEPVRTAYENITDLNTQIFAGCMQKGESYERKE
jgi:hypothetical protein